MGRRRLLAGGAATIAVQLPGCVVPSRTSTTLQSRGQPRGTLPPDFTLLSWNVHKDPRALAEAQAEFGRDAELLLLQEATGVRDDRWPAETMAVTFRRRSDGRPAGVLTASTVAPEAHATQLSRWVEPLARTPKSALVTVYAIADGRKLLVVNVHAVNFRRARALHEQLGSLVSVVREHAGPVIVAGDLNTWSTRRRAVASEFAKGLGLRSAFSGPDAPRLDAVLFRDLVLDGATRLRSRYSDHDPLRVRWSSTPDLK
ncbi:MAG: endonuclease/exonuclease/phosphatase family protein, partial [Myxococcota bacterium]